MSDEIPDYIPGDVLNAEGWRLLRDGLRLALELPEDELRAVIREVLDQLDEFPR